MAEIYLKVSVEDGTDEAAIAALADSVAEEEGVIEAVVLTEPHVVVTGDPFAEGFVIRGGLFVNEDEADDWATDLGERTWVVPINEA